MLHFGRAMNPNWDDDLARARLASADVPLDRRAGRLSGGQRAQVALALAVAKRPQVCCWTNRSPRWTHLLGGSS